MNGKSANFEKISLTDAEEKGTISTDGILVNSDEINSLK